MTLILQHGTHRTPFECRRIHPIIVRGRRWLAVLRIGPWSLVLAQKESDEDRAFRLDREHEARVAEREALCDWEHGIERGAGAR